MAKINLLSAHLADLIAAGEVVERPGSVIKELAENSIDAGATHITVEIRGGGMTFLRVADNGSGMPPEDAGIAFLRHATSKLRSESGLEAIGTLGFRGEALAAISAVSRIELLTREKGATEGTRILLEAGDIIEMGPAGCPEGTAITVRDLFYNTPARLKFLKSDRAEGGACLAAALRCALGAPDISMRCIRDGKEEFFSPGDGRADSCVYSLLGRDFASALLEAFSDDGGVCVSGFVGAPHAARGNRAGQYFFCNGRPFRSSALTAALEQAYKNSMMSGRYPSCVLYITLSASAVDVNVHPAKTEVKFSDERRVFDAVYYAALSALCPAGRTEEMPEPAEAKPARLPGQGAPGGERPAPSAAGTRREPPANAAASPAARPLLTVRDGADSAFAFPPPRREPLPPERPEPLPAPPEKRAEPVFRVVGEAMGTYIIAEQEGQLALIDKHAAHERIIFDRLRGRGGEIMSQTLLTPSVLSPSGEDFDILTENLPLLDELGFELEPYGESALILRGVPSGTDGGDGQAMLEEICRRLRRGERGDKEGARDKILRTVACKAAIKAGRGSQPEELSALCERVLSGEVRYCPHGRPVLVRLSKTELDKYFERA